MIRRNVDPWLAESGLYIMEPNTRFAGPWHVVSVATNRSIESHASEQSALAACRVLNAHEAQKDLPDGGLPAERYAVDYRELTRRRT